MNAVISAAQLKVADEVWIATALLQKEHPEAEDFSLEEIMNRARRESAREDLRPGVYVHIVQHCVANRAPNPGRYRMLYETVAGRRRLFRQGDVYHPAREGAKVLPELQELPDRYKALIRWYEKWVENNGGQKNDPLSALYGIGKQLWADEPADKYVSRLREEWE